jgi:transposase
MDSGWGKRTFRVKGIGGLRTEQTSPALSPSSRHTLDAGKPPTVRSSSSLSDPRLTPTHSSSSRANRATDGGSQSQPAARSPRPPGGSRRPAAAPEARPGVVEGSNAMRPTCTSRALCAGPARARVARGRAAPAGRPAGEGGRPCGFDGALYRQRNIVERDWNKLKQWRGIATRYDKTATNYCGGVYARIEEQGLQLTRYEEELKARMPTPDETRSLNLASGTPVLDLIRVAYAGDRAVEVLVSVVAADKHVFHYAVPRRLTGTSAPTSSPSPHARKPPAYLREGLFTASTAVGWRLLPSSWSPVTTSPALDCGPASQLAAA